jgi:uncharacterized phage-associated protein
MAHDIRVLGNRFVHLGREWDYPLTSEGLQKFIFLAHGWHMGLHGKQHDLHGVAVALLPGAWLAHGAWRTA